MAATREVERRSKEQLNQCKISVINNFMDACVRGHLRGTPVETEFYRRGNSTRFESDTAFGADNICNGALNLADLIEVEKRLVKEGLPVAHVSTDDLTSTKHVLKWAPGTPQSTDFDLPTAKEFGTVCIVLGACMGAAIVNVFNKYA